jgi:ABC-type transporter MlaC component
MLKAVTAVMLVFSLAACSASDSSQKVATTTVEDVTTAVTCGDQGACSEEENRLYNTGMQEARKSYEEASKEAVGALCAKLKTETPMEVAQYIASFQPGDNPEYYMLGYEDQSARLLTSNC